VSEHFVSLWQGAGFASAAAFGQAAGLDRRTLGRLRTGAWRSVRPTSLEKAARALGLGVGELVERLEGRTAVPEWREAASEWREEYDRLARRLAEAEVAQAELWNRRFFTALETFLVQWPTVRAAAERNPDLSATTVLDLLLPLEEFLREAGFEAIGSPGDQTHFDPTVHQGVGLVPGQPVRVRTVGYRYRGELLVRARVAAC
jgi:transcriptional regulator with XRE-family HTH domain